MNKQKPPKQCRLPLHCSDITPTACPVSFSALWAALVILRPTAACTLRPVEHEQVEARQLPAPRHTCCQLVLSGVGWQWCLAMPRTFNAHSFCPTNSYHPVHSHQTPFKSRAEGSGCNGGVPGTVSGPIGTYFPHTRSSNGERLESWCWSSNCYSAQRIGIQLCSTYPPTLTVPARKYTLEEGKGEGRGEGTSTSARLVVMHVVLHPSSTPPHVDRVSQVLGTGYLRYGTSRYLTSLVMYLTWHITLVLSLTFSPTACHPGRLFPATPAPREVVLTRGPSRPY